MSVAIETQPRLVIEPREQVSVTVPSDVRLMVSVDDFERLCRDNRDLRLERNAEGELIVMSPSGSESGAINAILTARLVLWSVSNRSGVAFDSSAGFTLPNGSVRSPDASWIKFDRWNALTDKQREGFAPIVLDFVVELCSPSDSRPEIRAKMVEYLEQGARLGWLIDPKTKEVEISRQGRPVEILKSPRTVSGEDVLPGFTLDLNEIFD